VLRRSCACCEAFRRALGSEEEVVLEGSRVAEWFIDLGGAFVFGRSAIVRGAPSEKYMRLFLAYFIQSFIQSFRLISENSISRT
jgi:hypothetical protein